MKNIEYFKGKSITVVGLARSGLACANLLYELGARVSVTDSQHSEITAGNAKRLKSSEIAVELGRHSPDFIKGRDLIVISPGVSNESEPVLLAGQLHIPIISEIEVASILCPATIIAVTGSNGKTTVTTLIGKILEAKGEKAVVCGNIGNPFCSELHRIKKNDFVSLEVSSFQLERIDKFRPKISVILNLTQNHLDRYPGMQEYIAAKKRIFINQKESDYLVLGAQGKVLIELAREARARVVYFSRTDELNPNQAAVLAVGSILGVDKDLCMRVFSDFKGIEHRLEEVAQVNDIKFINDSKATTADSVIWALENIRRPIILIAGGRHKGIDYKVVLGAARQKVKEVILIGEAKKIIADSFCGSLPIDEADSLQEAVDKAFSKASAGDCVLLSPMCSSYDMFTDYEERGRVFKKVVQDLAKRETSR